MSERRPSGSVRLSRWETLGAWLKVWTPPRDAEVPPVPKGKVAAVLLALIVVLGGAIALLAPAIEHSKQTRAEKEAQDLARARAVARRRIEREQRPMFAHSPRTRVGRLRAPAERRLRKAVLGDLEAAITRDARRRVRSGELDGPIRATACEPYPPNVKRIGAETTLRGTLGKYSCTAVQDYVKNGAADTGAVGYPFWARVDFGRLSFAWCRVNPRAGERTVGQDLVVVPPPKACDLGY